MSGDRRRASGTPYILALCVALLAGFIFLKRSVEKPTPRGSWSDVVASHASVHEGSNFAPDCLAYVTPWNDNGKEITKRFPEKFEYISPVWYQIRPGNLITGGHDVDKTWMAAVRDTTKAPKIVPRFIFEGWSPDAIVKVFSTKELGQMTKQVVRECKAAGVDGVVLEVFNSLGPAFAKSRNAVIKGLRSFGKKLQENQLILILVIPPHDAFVAKDLSDLAEAVERFQVMTYDFSHAGKPGPNSPIGWVEERVRALAPSDKLRSKILVGTNFYGNDYVPKAKKGGPIVGHEYLKLLEEHKPKLKWLAKEEEHMFEYTVKGERHEVYYPSRESLQARLDLATRLGVGLGIWEVGQGLDHFYDLL